MENNCEKTYYTNKIHEPTHNICKININFLVNRNTKCKKKDNWSCCLCNSSSIENDKGHCDIGLVLHFPANKYYPRRNQKLIRQNNIASFGFKSVISTE